MTNDAIDPIFAATVQATEEAIVNALVAGETMTGADDVTVPGIDHQKLRALLQKHGRLARPGGAP